MYPLNNNIMKRIVIIMGFVLMGCGVMRAENDTILWINHVIQVVDSAIPVTVSPSDWIGEWTVDEWRLAEWMPRPEKCAYWHSPNDVAVVDETSFHLNEILLTLNDLTQSVIDIKYNQADITRRRGRLALVNGEMYIHLMWIDYETRITVYGIGTHNNTHIETPSGRKNENDGQAYDLLGRPVNDTYHGIVIRDGKKYVL